MGSDGDGVRTGAPGTAGGDSPGAGPADAGPAPTPEGGRLRALQALDALTYAAVSLAVVVAVATVLGAVWALASGIVAGLLAATLVVVKFVLFLVGFGTVGYGTLKLRPPSPRSRARGRGGDDGGGLGGLAGIGGGSAPAPGGPDGEGNDDREADEGTSAKRQRARMAEGDVGGPADPPGAAADDDAAETSFQRVVQATPPMRYYELPPDARLPTGVRLFVAGLAMLVVSFLMESVLGVAAV